jgi:hypothetical protein
MNLAFADYPSSSCSMSLCWYDECQNADDQQAQLMTTLCTLWIIHRAKMLGNAPCDEPIFHK